jgi:plastocyanin
MTRRSLTVLGILFTFALVVIIGCGGGGSNSTNPGPTGPTLNFAFPATGVSHSFVFTDAGAWGYRCVAHGGMTGTVTVAAGGLDSVVVSVGPGNTTTFSPATTTIKVGGTVRWVLASTTMFNHTVTRP